MNPAGRRSSGLLEARFEECRREARSLLHDLMVEEPSEIDLMAVVGFLEGLTVEEGGLDGAEGRILWGRCGAAIRIKTGQHVCAFREAKGRQPEFWVATHQFFEDLPIGRAIAALWPIPSPFAGF